MKTSTEKLIASASIYAISGVAYNYIHDYGVGLYKLHTGGFTARGVAIGMTTYSTLYLFIAINLLVFALRNPVAKLVMIATMAVFILWFFLPEHPIRAIAYAGLTTGMSLFAIITRQAVERLFFRSNVNASSHK